MEKRFRHLEKTWKQCEYLRAYAVKQSQEFAINKEQHWNDWKRTANRQDPDEETTATINGFGVSPAL